MAHDGAAIAAALSRPDLFGPHFKGPSWDAWRAFVAALCAAPMTDDQLELYRQCTGRTAAPETPFTEAALVVGRRGGKSRILAFIAVALAVLRDYEEHLAAGEVATVGVLASTTKQGRSIFNYVVGLLKAIPSLQPMVLEQSADTILLSNRVQIEIAAASFRSTRGYTYAAILADEVAFWRSEESLNPDVEILRALRPGLASIPGSVLMLASSPYAKKGALYNSYRRNFGRDDARVLVWKASTEVMNPKISPAFIAEAYEEDPEAARAEYGVEFRDDLADFITREAIDAITAWGRHELPPEPGVHYRAFADPSGGASDSMCLAIGHQDNDLGILDTLLEIKAPFDPDQAVAECSALLRRYGVSKVVGDHFAGKWPVSRFAAHGISFEQSARPKSDLYADFLPLANARRVELLDHKRMASQFVGLERRVGRSGKDSIAEPKGAHDDCCNVVAGLLVGLDLDRRPALIRGDQIADDQRPASHRAPTMMLATVWVGMDGLAAWVIFSYSERDVPALVVMDFAAVPWHGGLLLDVATRLDAHCEAARDASPALQERGVHAVMHVPEQLEELATVAMTKAFESRFNRYDAHRRTLRVVPIGEGLLADPVWLMLTASAIVSGGDLKLSATAIERSRATPLMGALAIPPGESVTTNPLRVALLVGVAELDPQHTRAPAAKIAAG